MGVDSGFGGGPVTGQSNWYRRRAFVCHYLLESLWGGVSSEAVVVF